MDEAGSPGVHGCKGLGVGGIGVTDAGHNTLRRELGAVLGRAVALGGNALSGGKFNIWASVLGAYVIQFLTTTLFKFNVVSSALPAYKAVVVIILVVLSAPTVREKLEALKKRRGAKEKKEAGIHAE